MKKNKKNVKKEEVSINNKNIEAETYKEENTNNKEKIMFIIDIVRYFIGLIIMIVSLSYSDWRIVLYFISGLLFLPIIYKLLSNLIIVKYWVQIVIAIVFFAIMPNLENFYVQYNNLCETGETITRENCHSCPDGYTLDSDKKTCTITNDKLSEIIKQNLNNTNIKNINVEKNESQMYNITIDYAVDDINLYNCSEIFITFLNKIHNNEDIKQKTSNIYMNIINDFKTKNMISIADFNQLSNSKYQENIIFIDENGKKINTNIEQLKKDQIKIYKDNCKTYNYKTIFRYAEDYIGKKAKFTGQVVQVIESSSYRVNVTKDKWGFYDDTIFVRFTGDSSGTPRILEDDIITVYGTLGYLYMYETIFGASVTIPSLDAKYIELKK